MQRPTVLIAEAEPEQALSTRKLVVETAKFNVLTAHSTEEALEMLKDFPGIAAAVLVQAHEVDFDAIAKAFKASNGKRPVISLSPSMGHISSLADHNLSSYEPETLVQLLRELFGDPRTIKS